MMTEGHRTKVDKREEEDGKTWNYGQADTGRESQRLVYLDVLRFLATVFVIGAHTVSLGAAMAPAQSVRWYAYEICAYFFLCCNPLFVMISGALLLSVQGETPWLFYKKRFIRVLFPMLVYYVMYVCAKEGIRWIFPDHWPEMAVRILQGAPKEAPHFWLIYVILGLYILTPLLRLLVRRIPERLYGWSAAGILLFLTAYTCLDVFFENRVAASVVNSFVGVFLLGYILANFRERRPNGIVWIGGILSAGGAVWMILNDSAYHRYVFNNAPLMVLYSMTVFLAIKEIFGKKKTVPAALQLVSRYSYGILLIHWGMLHFLVKRMLGIVPMTLSGVLLMVVFTLFFSFVGALVVDRTLIAGLIRLAQSVGQLLGAVAGRIRRASS